MRWSDYVHHCKKTMLPWCSNFTPTEDNIYHCFKLLDTDYPQLLCNALSNSECVILLLNQEISFTSRSRPVCPPVFEYVWEVPAWLWMHNKAPACGGCGPQRLELWLDSVDLRTFDAGLAQVNPRRQCLPQGDVYPYTGQVFISILPALQITFLTCTLPIQELAWPSMLLDITSVQWLVCHHALWQHSG